MTSYSKHTLDNLAQWATQWLERETRTHQNIWIWVENREAGVDLAQLLFKRRFGDFAEFQVPYDTLPTYAANAHTMNRVFLLCQPNHAEACLITMQPDDARMASRALTDGEKRVVERLAKSREVDLDIDQVVYLDQQMKLADFQLKAPNVLVVDVAEPVWDILKMYIAPETKVLLSDRVTIQPPLKNDA